MIPGSQLSGRVESAGLRYQFEGRNAFAMCLSHAMRLNLHCDQENGEELVALLS